MPDQKIKFTICCQRSCPSILLNLEEKKATITDDDGGSVTLFFDEFEEMIQRYQETKTWNPTLSSPFPYAGH